MKLAPRPCRSWALCPKESGVAESSGPAEVVPASGPPCWEPNRLRCVTAWLENDSSELLWDEEKERKEEAQDVDYILAVVFIGTHKTVS